MQIPEELHLAVERHPYPILFATISGAHLYGFPSADSDWDLRGAHILPVEEVVGLNPLHDTIEVEEDSTIELDLVTHDVRKFFNLLLKPNGYVLEQVLSPLVVFARPEHNELVQIARKCVTRFHVHHYLGFAANQWQLFSKEIPPRVKPLLYVFRVLLTGIHLMRTGEVEANLAKLNAEEFRLDFIPDLIARKSAGSEQGKLDARELLHFERHFQKLEQQLREAGEATRLPPTPQGRDELNDLLIRLRMSGSNYIRS